MEQIMSALPESLKALAHGFDVMTPEQLTQAQVDIYNASVGNLNEEDGYNCDLCKNKGHISKVSYNDQFGPVHGHGRTGTVIVFVILRISPCRCKL